MKIIYLIILIATTFGRTVRPDFTDLYYNTEYSLINDYSRNYNEYTFRAQVYPNDEMDLEIKISKNDPNYFTIVVYEFDHMPNKDEVLYDTTHNRPYRVKGDPYTEDNCWVYPFTYQVSNWAYYFSIHIYYDNTWVSFDTVIFRIDLTKYKYSKIKELNYNTDYQIDTKRFSGNDYFIPPNYQIYIRIAVHSEDKMEIRLTTHEANDKDKDFKVDVCQYTTKPTEEQVYYGNKAAKCENGLKNESDKTKEYVYPFTTIQDINYLSISIINQYGHLSYLNIFIYSETGMKIGIIILIVVACILVVGGIIGFVMKKMGCIGNK